MAGRLRRLCSVRERVKYGLALPVSLTGWAGRRWESGNTPRNGEGEDRPLPHPASRLLKSGRSLLPSTTLSYGLLWEIFYLCSLWPARCFSLLR